MPNITQNPINFAISLILVVIGGIIGITALVNQAPTVASMTSTATGTALANAGVTSSTLAGTVYGFVNVLWALAVFLVPVALVVGLFAHQKGYI